MPWKESCLVNERMMFVSRVKAGEKISDLCAELGISRKTAHKFLTRFDKQGPAGLYDASRRPRHCPNETSAKIQELIVKTKQDKPTWGAGKIREWLLRKNSDLKLPSRFTVHAILNRYNLVNRRAGRRKSRSDFMQTPIVQSQKPNEIWCADFKGQFQLGSKRYCYPLTITDHYSRYIISCEALEATKADATKEAFKSAFEEYGLPEAIRTDNGTPFASGGLFGLSELSVWWMRLGIKLQRIEPGHPEQNGRHERMHLTLKKETTRPPGKNILQQQEKFDVFQSIFNEERPHEALGMKVPADLYAGSKTIFTDELPDLEYPFHDFKKTVSANGNIKLGKHVCCYLSQALRYQAVGFKEEDDGLWLVTFMDMNLGLIDVQERKFVPFNDPQITEGII